jgi:hypothetical protein
MSVNWALGLQQGNAGDAFAQSFKQGQVDNRQNMARSAMAALVANPKNERALQALASVDPQAAQQFQQQQQQAALAGLEQHRDNIVKGAQLIRQMQPKDDAGWQQVLQVAHQAGIDVSEVPPHFDPQYVQGVVQLADTFAPQPGAQGKDIPVQQGGSVLHVNPDGTSRWTVMPAGDAPQPLTDEQMRAMEGGQSPQGSGGFRH